MGLEETTRLETRDLAPPTPPLPPGVAADDLAYRDDLTGLFSRRLLSALFATGWQDLVARHQRVALVILDLDGFKEINDRRGHLAGDEVLRVAARLLQASFRGSDLLVRYGGDEFVAVLPGVGAAEARGLAERTREIFLEETQSGDSRSLGVSFSIGVAAAPEDGATGEAVLEVADRALYEEKRARRLAQAVAHRPSRLRWPMAALLALLTLGPLAILAWNLFGPAPELPPPAPLARPLEAIAATPSADEIEALQAEVRRLTLELAAARRQDSRRGADTRAAALEAKLAELQTQLDRAAPTPEPSSPQPTAEPAATPAPTEPAPPLPATPRATPPARASAQPPAPAALYQPPQLLASPPPAYPAMALRARRFGEVEFVLQIDAEGRVLETRQQSPALGFGLDEAARTAALAARYRPATRDGQPVAGEARLTLRFTLP